MASNSRNSGISRTRVDDDDRMSNLPCEVIDHILQFLPLKDAVRTSILSTNWRSQWAMLPKLVLDRRFFSDVLKFNCPCKLQLCQGGHELLEVDNTHLCSFNISPENFVLSEVVSSMLVRHVGPIHNFTLHIPHWFPEYAGVVIGQWVEFVSGKFVKEFTITQDQGITREGLDKSRELPMSMFNPMGFNDLTHLTIMNFGLPFIPTNFKGFPSLVSLDVRARRGGEQSSGAAHVLGILVSKCPQLESLDCYIFDGEGCLTIRAPKLRNLRIGGDLSGLCFEETKKIEVFNVFNLQIVYGDTILTEWFSSLPLVRILILGFSFLENLPRNGRLRKPPCELGQLKQLRLAGLQLDSPFAISFILTLFKMASNLQNLALHLRDTSHSQSSVGDMIDEHDCCLEHLKTVTTSCLGPTSGDILLQLIKLILSSSPVLEVMTIGVPVRGKLLNLDQLLQCPRASANANIIIRT